MNPVSAPPRQRPRLGSLFNYDWDAQALERLTDHYTFDTAGFDLFSFPSNARLVGFDIERFATAQAARGRRLGWAGVTSQHEQFGALAAALVAEKLGLPGTAPNAILAAQHKLHARRVLERVCPEANLPFAELDCAYGADIPDGITYPRYVKPIKAAFSVLARQVGSRAELQAHTRFGWRELWVIRRLVEPFERVCRARLPEAGTAHRLMLEAPMQAPQFNLDGWVFQGQAHALGVVDAIMYPGTQAFMRWDFPSLLPNPVQARALEVAQKFLSAIGFTHGLFNMEFFFDPVTDKLTVIEFNPRLASQFGDLYRRVRGIDPHHMSVALALGQDPAALPRSAPTAGAASSLVYRALTPDNVPTMPTPAARRAFAAAFPDALLFEMAKTGHSLDREFKWLGSHRYGIVHLGGRDADDLRHRSGRASGLLGWPSPYAGAAPLPAAAPAPLPRTTARPLPRAEPRIRQAPATITGDMT